MKLTKSLAELDAAADELLAKSQAVQDTQETDEDVKPDEVSDENATPAEDAENADAEKDEDIEKCDANGDVADIKKSEEVPAEEGETPAEEKEDIEKSCDDVKKSENADEAEETSEAGEPTEEDIHKSLQDEFEAEDTVKKSMAESEFASSIVDILVKSLGDVQYDVQTAGRQQSAASEVLAKSLQAVISENQSLHADNERLTRRINKLEKSISGGFEKIMDAIDEMSTQPAHMRKSMASIHVQDRDFDRSINGQQTVGGFESLSKSQVLTVLNNELYAGNQNVTPSDIISYESGAPLRSDLQTLVASKCK